MKENSYKFKWQDIGNIEIGRPNLGRNTDVAVYRLMQYTMRSVLNNELGGEKASEMFFKSGFLAGSEFCANLLDTSLDIHAFIANLQEKLKALGIGILRIEEADIQNHKFTLTVAEDLDCSGLPITNETVCEYDEGFISGILTHYTGLDFIAKEIDCWSTGDRVCRFKVGLKDGKNNIADNLAAIIRNMMARGYVEELPPNIHDHIMDIEDVSIRNFMQQTAILLSHLQQSQQYILELASGNLNAETENKSLLLSPFKQLQANLKHLTWQAQRIAEGDLNQHIDFMGDFSTYFNQLIQSLKEKRVVENALKYSNENYKISFENANIGIMTVNFDGIIISANKECEKIFGYSRDELEGINVNAYSFTTDLSLSREFIDSALRMPEHGKQVFIKRFYHKSGRIITCEISSSLLVDLSGNPIHFVSHIKDITLQMEMEQKQRQLNAELEEKVRKLKETNDARDKFMSIIAHDLKNPFNVILGFSSFLSNHLEELSSDEIKTYASNIHQATFSTFQLLQTLLEWANAQRGRMIFNPETIEAGSIMDEVIATVKNNAAAKNITISYDKDSVIKVNADHTSIQSQNLVIGN